jgi:hypothetical protein
LDSDEVNKEKHNDDSDLEGNGNGGGGATNTSDTLNDDPSIVTMNELTNALFGSLIRDGIDSSIAEELIRDQEFELC